MKVTKTHIIKARGDLNGKAMATAIELNGSELNLFGFPKDPSKLPIAFGDLGLTAKQSEAFGLVRNFIRWKIQRMNNQKTSKG
jgi:hypothetical protein